MSPLVTRLWLWSLPIPFGVALPTRNIHMFLCIPHEPHRSQTIRVFSIPAGVACSAQRNTTTTMES